MENFRNMENLHEEINDITQYEVDTKRIEKLRKKQRPKTKAQRLKGFFIVLTVLGFVCQFLSALLASSGVIHYVSEKLNNNGLIISLTSICVLLFIEGSKRFTLESYHAQRLDDNRINKITYGFILLWGFLSIGSTYVGTPYAVEFFAAAPELVNVDSVSNSYDILLNQDKDILNKELKSHKATADSIKKAASWKGRISRDDRPAYMAALTAAKNVETKLSEVHLLRNNEKLKKIDDVLKENEKTLNTHSAWCYSFGYNMALVSIFLELLFFVSFYWCEGYKRLEVIEAKAITALKERKDKEAIPTVTPTNTDTETKVNNVTVTDKETLRTPTIGFTTAVNRTCSNCGTDISNKRSDAKFCSTKCRALHHKNKK